MIMLDGLGVKVGDRLYCLATGWMKVTEIREGVLYQIYGISEIGQRVRSWTATGCYIDGGLRTLYRDEIKITPPLPPKRMVKKWRFLIRNRNSALNDWCSSTIWYDSAAEASTLAGDQWVIGDPIIQTEMEVEE